MTFYHWGLLISFGLDVYFHLSVKRSGDWQYLYRNVVLPVLVIQVIKYVAAAAFFIWPEATSLRTSVEVITSFTVFFDLALLVHDIRRAHHAPSIGWRIDLFGRQRLYDYENSALPFLVAWWFRSGYEDRALRFNHGDISLELRIQHKANSLTYEEYHREWANFETELRDWIEQCLSACDDMDYWEEVEFMKCLAANFNSEFYHLAEEAGMKLFLRWGTIESRRSVLSINGLVHLTDTA